MAPESSSSTNGTRYRLMRIETVQEAHSAKLAEHSVMAVRLEERLGRLGEDVRECTEALNSMKEGQEKRAEEQRKEKKADRRWWIGTVLAIISAILVAAGIVANAI